jgi:hypothetical protein
MTVARRERRERLRSARARNAGLLALVRSRS